MAYIEKRGKAYNVRYSYRDENGKRKVGYEAFPTEEEAKVRAKEVELEQVKGIFIAPSSTTVTEYLLKWIDLQSSKNLWAPKTYNHNKKMIMNHISPYIGEIPVQKLSMLQVEELYNTLKKTPCGQYVMGERMELSERQQQKLLSGTTIHEVHVLLRTAFSCAVEWELVHRNPVPKNGPKNTTEERECWDMETFHKAFSLMEENPILHLMLHLTILGTLRQGELAAISVEDIDFEALNGRGSITIRKTMQRIQKELVDRMEPSQLIKVFPDQIATSGSSLVLKATKTKKSMRTIPMTTQLKEELRRHLERLKEEEQQANGRYQNSGMLFRLPNGAPVEPTLIRKWLEGWLDEHPEFPRVCFHSFRHTGATNYLMLSEGDIKSVQGFTGHSRAETLVNVYGHINQSGMMRLANRFEESFYKTDSAGEAGPLESGKLDGEALLDILKNSKKETVQQIAKIIFSAAVSA